MGSGRPVAASQEGPQAADRLGRLEARPRLTGEERLGRSRRLVRGTDLQRINRTGRRSRQPNLDIKWVTNDLDHARLGLIVPRHGQTAVARNRLQRRLRELWRREVQGHLPSIDVVIRTQPASYAADFAALRTDLLAWVASLS